MSTQYELLDSQILKSGIFYYLNVRIKVEIRILFPRVFPLIPSQKKKKNNSILNAAQKRDSTNHKTAKFASRLKDN